MRGTDLSVLAAGFAIAAVVLPFFAGLRVHPDPADPWRLGPTFVLLLCAGAAGTAAISLSLFLIRRKAAFPSPRHDSIQQPHAALFLGGGALLVAAVVAALQPRPAWGALARGFGFIGARDPWLSTIDEFRPLATSALSLLAAFPSVPVFLVTLALALRGARKIPAERRAEVARLATAALAFLALALAQKRLLPPAAALSAAAAGAAWIPLAPAALWVRRGALTAGIVVATRAFLLSYLSIAFSGTAAPVVSPGEEAAAALVALTPAPSNPPEWGVLAPWDYGHDLLTRFGPRRGSRQFRQRAFGVRAGDAQSFSRPTPRRPSPSSTRCASGTSSPSIHRTSFRTRRTASGRIRAGSSRLVTTRIA